MLALAHFRFLAVIGNPIVAAVILFGSLIVFCLSPLFGLPLRTHTGYVLMTLDFLLVGHFFAWVLVGIGSGPWHLLPMLRLVIRFGAMSFQAAFGVALASGRTLLAPGFFSGLHLSCRVGLLTD